MSRNSTLSISADQHVEISSDYNNLSCKKVHFPVDNQLVDLVISGDEVWRIDPSIPNEEIIDRYVAACCSFDRKPLYSIIEQLSKVSIPFALSKFPAFIFKGIQLCLEDIEALEQVFKCCQCYHLSFENCNLDDLTLPVVLDMIDYYAVCSELCLGRNRNLNSDSIKLIAAFITKYSNLVWLDIRGIPILFSDAQLLSLALRSQVTTARILIRKHIAVSSNGQSTTPPIGAVLDEDKVTQNMNCSRKLCNSILSPNCCKTKNKDSILLKTLADLPPQCLRGLHLGETRISGPSLFQLAAGIRIAGQLADLRLPSNSLIASDMSGLVPLLRYCSSLQVLDLSYNQIGDEGCEILASALSRPSYATSALDTKYKTSCCILRRLYLISNNLHYKGAQALASALPICLKLTHLDVSENPEFATVGFHDFNLGLSFCRRLVYLGLDSCGLDCPAAISLSELIADTPRSLRRVNLGGNYIGDAGLLAILRSLPFCSSILHIDGLEDNQKATSNSSHLRRISTSTSSTVMSSRRVSSSHRKSVEVSPLKAQILQQIHAQLAANYISNCDKSPDEKTPPSPLDADHCSSSSITTDMFRGYRKCSFLGSDPRYLPGDSCSEPESTSSSSSSSEDESVAPVENSVL